MATIQIMIADDHKIIRDGIKSMLENKHGFDIVAEATDGEEAIAQCADTGIDLIIMDVNMPGKNGIEATQHIKRKYPEIKILALTMMKEDEHIRQMIQAGASGYILKNSGSDELVEAIEKVMDDKHYFSSDATYSVMMDLVETGGKKKKSGDPTDLTDRELEVLELITHEYTNQEIAEELTISVRTVDAHRRNILQKTGARNAAGLVRFALENNLFD
ncbi:response regulator transcription factor [Aliifodinibius sp. S!AR15-10]|uniref:response regulator transcription factor n=1 Tax=Aliifodinibius sp. S!AR15-10 TaxID=2950437 RepID=UPI002866BBED|nr:response regulator transcription factor [Aliifodinibius sp. S!AR15-10]MDR8389620.1 response regulator transcription factor [Aliifodinibius sp. S!AR15-10]